MRQDLSTELHLPKFDINSIKTVIIHNTTRLLSIVKQHDDYVIKNNIDLPDYKGFSMAMLSESPEINCQTSHAEQNHLVLNGECKAKDNINRYSIKLKNSNEKQCFERIFQPNKNVNYASDSLALDLGWGSNDEEEENLETVSSEIRPCPTRVNLDSELPVSWENDFWMDKSSEMELNVCDGEFLYATKTNSEDIPEPLNTSECHNQQPLCHDSPLTELKVNSSRCYSRKKTKGEFSSVIKKTDNKPLSQHSSKLVDNNKDTVVISNEEKSQCSICVITQVSGNADTVFTEANNSPEDTEELPEAPLITPKKTNDITKIKGWRRKQFFVEKSTKDECLINETEEPSAKKIKTEIEEIIPENVENAFVCDSLDEFLDNEAMLNIEIPHLYAEVGIKLTSDEVLSRPNFSDKDFKELETKYSVVMKLADNNILETEDSKRGIKRLFGADMKLPKFQENGKELAESELLLRSKHFKSKSEQEKTSPSKISTSVKEKINGFTLTSKLIGVVVYPGYQPLHPLVRYHLRKLRSYYTKIDKNWANFAASAVLSNSGLLKRRSILPVYLCGKLKTSEAVTEVQRICNPLNTDTSIEFKSPPQIKFANHTSHVRSILKNPVVKLKECRVIINRISTNKTTELWCMEHNCYNCMPCGLLRSGEKRSNTSGCERTNDRGRRKDFAPSFGSPQSYFNKSVASLLAQKLRSIKRNQSTLCTSIDGLKTLLPNSVELIKLNFVKKSFLTNYVNIWYLKPQCISKMSRAFLTFSQTPPVPYAINVKSNMFSSKCLPKVIKEIVYPEKQFDSNEYAVIHFNGKIWEIHGSLNIDVENKETSSENFGKNIEHIFTSNSLPEMVQLQKLALSILKLDHAKWWVLDLSQKFDKLEILSGSRIMAMSRDKLISFSKTISAAFVSIRNDFENRVLGAYISVKLLPFVVIGPYYFTEDSGLTIKIDSMTVPFSYSGGNVSDNLPLKFFINSVILEHKDRYMKVEGLWLCDRVLLDNTCYLEVISSDLPDLTKKLLKASKENNIKDEHDYSLRIDPSSASVESAKNSKGNPTKVYLYFDIFSLGYIEGHLQPDNSVIIDHPLSKGTKIMSEKIGDCFIGIIRRRIRFMPKTLKIRWFVTKLKEDLRGRKPFNKFFLGGTHILCRSGIHFLLRMTESKIKELGLDKREITTAIAKSRVINLVKQLRVLANILKDNSNGYGKLSMKQVLSLAVKEIKSLQMAGYNLFRKKQTHEMEKLRLGWLFLSKLHSCRARDEFRIKMTNKIIHFFQDKNGHLSEDFVKRLKRFNFGRKYLQKLKIISLNSQTLRNEK